MTPTLTEIGHGIEQVGRKAALEAATARRYSDLAGGEDNPMGELWSHLSHLADLVTQLACWIIEDQVDHEPDNPHGVWCCESHRVAYDAERAAPPDRIGPQGSAESSC